MKMWTGKNNSFQPITSEWENFFPGIEGILKAEWENTVPGIEGPSTAE